MSQLAHALEQVAAAKLMAEALEAEHRYISAKIEAIGHGFGIRYRAKLTDVLRRYQRLMWTKKRQALSAWKALEVDK